MIAVAVFVVVASISVVGPVAFYLIAADKAAAPLASIKGSYPTTTPSS